MHAPRFTLRAVMFASLAVASSVHAAPVTGASIFQNNCASCHTVDATRAPLAGSGLFGVVDRKAAAVPGFAYSDALTRSGAAGTMWTRAELDAFLRDPAKRVPGTTMPVGVADDTTRTALIAYLATLQGVVAPPRLQPPARRHAAAPGMNTSPAKCITSRQATCRRRSRAKVPATAPK